MWLAKRELFAQLDNKVESRLVRLKKYRTRKQFLTVYLNNMIIPQQGTYFCLNPHIKLWSCIRYIIQLIYNNHIQLKTIFRNTFRNSPLIISVEILLICYDSIRHVLQIFSVYISIQDNFSKLIVWNSRMWGIRLDIKTTRCFNLIVLIRARYELINIPGIDRKFTEIIRKVVINSNEIAGV